MFPGVEPQAVVPRAREKPDVFSMYEVNDEIHVCIMLMGFMQGDSPDVWPTMTPTCIVYY